MRRKPGCESGPLRDVSWRRVWESEGMAYYYFAATVPACQAFAFGLGIIQGCLQ